MSQSDSFENKEIKGVTHVGNNESREKVKSKGHVTMACDK